MLIKNLSVLEPERWPNPNQMPEDFGTSEIIYLCDRFDFDRFKSLNSFRDYLENGGKKVASGLQQLINLLNVIPISSCDCERGFTAQNLICTDLRLML